MAANFPTPAAPGEQWTDPGTGIVWEWDGEKWSAAGGITGGGVIGPEGPAGPAGPAGPSAYETAVANGFVGTEAEWLASLEGEPGLAGPTAVSADAGNASRLGADSLLYTPATAATAPLLSDGSTVSIDLTTVPAATALGDTDLLLVQQGADKYSTTFEALQAAVLCGYIIKSDLPPDPATDPCIEEGMIWVDTSKDPPTINVWDPGANGGAGGWVDGGTGGGGGTGPGLANPLPGQTTAVPPFEGGTGTIDNPYILTAATAFAGGKASSAQTITFQGQPVGSLVSWVDNNSGTNGGRYNQPIGTVNSSGLWSGKLGFYDTPAAPSLSYTGLLVCGGVYFTWGVGTLDSGIETPTILELLDVDGAYYSAPTEPAYLTGSTVGSVYSASAITGLTPSAETTPIAVSGGTGTGLSIKVSATISGDLGIITIVSPGIGYTYDDSVVVDLSSIGGSATQAMKVRTSPVTTSALSVKLSPFVGINAGTVKSTEWEFDDTPAFLAPRTATVNSTAVQITVQTGANSQSEYYMRFRYVSTTGAKSEYSPIARGATGQLWALRYVLRDFLGAGVSYDSGEFIVPASAGATFWAISDAGFPTAVGGTGGYGDDGISTPSPGGYPGAKPRGAVYLSWRSPVVVQVATVDPVGAITSITVQQRGKGLRDVNANSIQAFTSSSTGTGATFNIQKDSDKLTTAILSATGIGYKVGDVLSWIDGLGVGDGNTMDKDWDVLLHGVAGDGAPGGNGNSGPGQGAKFVGAPTGGGTSSNLLVASPGSQGSSNGGDYCVGGGGGGAGWGGGPGGSNGDGCCGNIYNGFAGYSKLNTAYIKQGVQTTTNYGAKAVELMLGGVQVKLVKSDIGTYPLS
jgi:hypothetical protein